MAEFYDIHGNVRGHPQDQDKCPDCHQRFDAPRVEEDGDMLNLFCPLCDYQFARWTRPAPKVVE